MHRFALILHLLGASVWVGGHLYLLFRLMPTFIKNNDIKGFLAFEKSYEPLGLTALAVQVVTGLYMMNGIVAWQSWLSPMGMLSGLIHGKLTWLALTIITALSARFLVVAKLENGTHRPNTLKIMGVHVGLICLWAVAFVVTGAWFRG